MYSHACVAVCIDLTEIVLVKLFISQLLGLAIGLRAPPVPVQSSQGGVAAALAPP